MTKKRTHKPCIRTAPSQTHLDAEALETWVLDNSVHTQFDDGAVYFVVKMSQPAIARALWGHRHGDPMKYLGTVNRHQRKGTWHDTGEPCTSLVKLTGRNQGAKTQTLYVFRDDEERLNRYLTARDQTRQIRAVQQQRRAHKSYWEDNWLIHDFPVLLDTAMKTGNFEAHHFLRIAEKEVREVGVITEDTMSGLVATGVMTDNDD